jgi:hypothetical protein
MQIMSQRHASLGDLVYGLLAYTRFGPEVLHVNYGPMREVV